MRWGGAASGAVGAAREGLLMANDQVGAGGGAGAWARERPAAEELNRSQSWGPRDRAQPARPVGGLSQS